MPARGRLPALLIATFAIAVVLTTVAHQLLRTTVEADSDEHGAANIRISAMRLADGRIEFAVQQRDGDAWGERLLPKRRLFPVAAPVGTWLNSSPIGIATPQPPAGAMPMLCVVADGDPNKLFWQLAELHTERAAKLIGVELEYSTHPDVGDRVAAIEACVEHGAQMIVATLANADTIIPALHEAVEHGVKIASFGAGEGRADEAGSLIHVSLNEAAAGRRAAQQFNAHGVTGPLLCLVNEDAYAARQNICNVLKEHYLGGEVLKPHLGLTNEREQIEVILTEVPDAGGLLVLEADLLPPAIEAIEHSGANPVLGSIGEYPLSRLSFAQRDLIAFTVMDLARVEALLPMAALHLMYRYHPNARFFEGALIFNGVPNVHTGGAEGGHGRERTGQQTDDHRGDDGHGQ